MKKLYSMGLFLLVMLISTLPVSAMDHQKYKTTVLGLKMPNVTIENELDLVDAIATTSGVEKVIELTQDITLTAMITIPAGKNIVIQSPTGSTYVIKQVNHDVRHFEVRGQLVLENVILDGDEVGGGVFVSGTGSSLTLKEDATIQKCNSTSAGGGVEIESSGTLVMEEGSTVKLNKSTYSTGSPTNGGGGISVYNGTFSMFGGLISENNARNGGGVHISGSSGKFGMIGGTITKNKASLNYGGGVYIGFNSAFTLDNGFITDNGATYGGGIFSHGTFTMNHGVINKNEADRGGGICAERSTIIMNGGIIGGDTTEDANQALTGSAIGGGVSLCEGTTFTMNDNAVIKNNVADSGGGIHLYSTSSISTMIMNGNSLITSNRSLNTGGGIYCAGNGTGVLIMNNDSTITMNVTESGGGLYAVNTLFTMNDHAKITYNQAETGGGIFVTNNNIFTMNDDTYISNNTANGTGGGVFVNQYNNMIMNGDSLIKNNSAGTNGGGIYQAFGTKLEIKSGRIEDNVASESGGGVYIWGTADSSVDNSAKFHMTGGVIQRNRANGSTANSGGGGIYYNSQYGTLLIDTNEASIINNSAPLGWGGGIFCTWDTWGKMIISNKTIFNGNTAHAAHLPPENAETIYSTIQFASLSIPMLDHSLNNYDINFKSTIVPTTPTPSSTPTIVPTPASPTSTPISTIPLDPIPNTGDNTSNPIYIIGLGVSLVSLLGLIGFLMKRRKETDQRK